MKNWWFSPKSPFDLAFCRVIWFGLIFCYYLPFDFSLWSDVPNSIHHPVSFFSFSWMEIPSADTLNVLQTIWRISLAASCLGFLTRCSTTTAFCVGIYLLCIPNCWGKTSHQDAITCLTMGILAFSRCGDALSLDAWLKKNPPPSNSGEYQWPIKCVWVALCLIFLAAGVSKLRKSGLDWMNPENLRITLLSHQYYFGGCAPTKLGVYIAQSQLALWTMSISTIAIECGLVLALLHWKLRIVLVPAALGMLIGIPVTMGPLFLPLIITYLFWIPWEEIKQYLTSRPPLATDT